MGEDGVWEKGMDSIPDGAEGTEHRDLFGKLGSSCWQQSVKDGGSRKSRVSSGVGAGSGLHLFHTLVTNKANTGQKKKRLDGFRWIDLWLIPSVATDATFASIYLPLASEPPAVALVVVVVGGVVEAIPPHG